VERVLGENFLNLNQQQNLEIFIWPISFTNLGWSDDDDIDDSLQKSLVLFFLNKINYNIIKIVFVTKLPTFHCFLKNNDNDHWV
jgi:hypothetical protein